METRKAMSRSLERTSRRMDASIDAIVAGCPIYPNGTTFVAADTENIGEILLQTARERSPVLIVYPDGEERLLLPSQRLDARWIARLRGGLRRARGRVLGFSARGRRACRRTAAP
jgi:hypothetical protein